MPELPEVETTKASLDNLINQTIIKVDVYQPKLRWAMPPDLSSLKNYKLIQVLRRAKYLILTFQSTTDKVSEKKLIIHLGMSGSLQQQPIGTTKRKHDHLILTFDANIDTLNTSHKQHDGYQLHYHDPRRFGAVLWYADYGDKLLSHLGVEPLEDRFNADYLYKQIWRIDNHKNADNLKISPAQSAKKRPITRPIKSVIMDQEIVVGVGNIYATESLFLSGIHPLIPANQIGKKELQILVKHIKAVLHSSIKKGGSTLKDFTVADGKTGYFQQTLNVYGKHNQPCPICATTIEKVTITGRSSTFCPNCQQF